jgi:hypothetical protein
MKIAATILAFLMACAMGGAAVFGIVGATVKAGPQHPVCLISHRAVILIPTVCHDRHEDRNELCQRPIVAELCDSVEMPAK